MTTVGWLNLYEGPVVVLAGRGVRGGLRLYPPYQRERIEATIKDLASSAATADSSALDLARWLGMMWEVSIEADGRLILPEPARKLGLAPSATQVGVVFAYGEILEIWELQAWERYCQKRGEELVESLELDSETE